MNHFYFQTLLNTALDGINGGGVTHAMKLVGNGILVATVLYQIYMVWWRDGDYHELGTVLVKAMLMATLFNSYDTVFRLAVDGFNGLADIVYSSTPGLQGDMVKNWLTDVGNHWDIQSLKDIWTVVSGGIAAFVNLILLTLSYMILPVVYVLFSFAYLIVGVVLYALGQIVLAVYPSGALGPYTQAYFKNLVIWGLWPMLYALFADLMSVVQMNSVDNVLNQNSFLGGFVGLGSSLLLGLAGIVFAIAIALIPVIAHHIVTGNIGQAVAVVVRSLGSSIKPPGGGK